MEKITTNDLREHLDHYSAEFQKMVNDPSIPPEYQSLLTLFPGIVTICSLKLLII